MVLSDVADVVGIAGAAVSVATFLRVRTIARAREEEREQLERALKLRELNSALASNASRIGAGKLDESQLDAVSRDLLALGAELDAAIRILLPSTPNLGAIEGIETLDDGYWTDTFAAEYVARAKERVVFVCWRNSRALKEELLSLMLRRLESNPRLTIEIFAMARDATDSCFEDMCRMLELGDAATMRRQQVFHVEIANSFLKRRAATGPVAADAIRRLHYFEYNCAPVVHCCVVDDEVSWGINFFMDSMPGVSDSLERAFIRTNARTEFGQKVLEQVGVIRGLDTTNEFYFMDGVEDEN